MGDDEYGRVGIDVKATEVSRDDSLASQMVQSAWCSRCCKMVSIVCRADVPSRL